MEKVADYAAITGYGVMATPALVVDDAVLVCGRVPGPAEIAALLGAASTAG